MKSISYLFNEVDSREWFGSYWNYQDVDQELKEHDKNSYEEDAIKRLPEVVYEKIKLEFMNDERMQELGKKIIHEQIQEYAKSIGKYHE